ncbi:hypothetical protein YC2023_034250 [Brassica napus]
MESLSSTNREEDALFVSRIRQIILSKIYQRHTLQTLASLLDVKMSYHNSLPASGHRKLQVYFVAINEFVGNLNSKLAPGLSETGPKSLFPLLQCTSIVWRTPNLLIITTCLGDEIPNVDAFVRIIKNKNDVKKNLRFVEKTIIYINLNGVTQQSTYVITHVFN